MHGNLTWEREHQRDGHGRFRQFYVPREQMPQVDAMYQPRMVADAIKGPGVTFDTVSPESLIAHQRVDHAKARAIDLRGRMKPLIVSSDDYVVDGNHRWWSSVHAGAEWVNVIRLAIPFDQAIEWLRRRPYVYEITPTTPERT